MSEVFGLDFDKLAKEGISKAKTLNYLQTQTENNFNFTELEQTYRRNGYDDEQVTNALYADLQEAGRRGEHGLNL